jgi:hypothetical protein
MLSDLCLKLARLQLELIFPQAMMKSINYYSKYNPKGNGNATPEPEAHFTRAFKGVVKAPPETGSIQP